MKKSVLVVGVGRFGRGVIESLFEMGHEVFAIDSTEGALDDVRDMIVSGAIINVAENDDELSRIVGKKNFDAAVVAMGIEFEAALIAAHVIKEAGIPMYAKAASERRGNILNKMGVEQVVFPERDSGRRLAHFINNSDAVDILDLPQGYIVEQMTIGEGFDQKTILELNLGRRLEVKILLIYHNATPIAATASARLQKGDTMIVFGQKTNVHALEKENSKR